jgi:UDP-N-acetyl-D-mannosaminuronate dehydrogenase
LFELLKESAKFSVYGLDTDEKKMREAGQIVPPSEVDIIHICIPCREKDVFVEATLGYVKQFKPILVIINSTIVPGASMDVHNRCRCLVAHSPIRGMHENFETMKRDVKRWTKYIGGADAKAAEATNKHFKKLGLKTSVLNGCAETELAKLFDTAYRVWMITCFQEMHRISRHFKTDFCQIMNFLADGHRGRLDRPIMFPGVIGGHCLVPNLELLLRSYDSEFLRLALKSNKKRRKEIENEDVRIETEKAKGIAEGLQMELTGRRH